MSKMKNSRAKKHPWHDSRKKRRHSRAAKLNLSELMTAFIINFQAH